METVQRMQMIFRGCPVSKAANPVGKASFYVSFSERIAKWGRTFALFAKGLLKCDLNFCLDYRLLLNETGEDNATAVFRLSVATINPCGLFHPSKWWVEET